MGHEGGKRGEEEREVKEAEDGKKTNSKNFVGVGDGQGELAHHEAIHRRHAHRQSLRAVRDKVRVSVGHEAHEL